MGELAAAAGEGRLLEAFGCGTACVLAPIGAIVRDGAPPIVPRNIAGLAGRLYNRLLDIQVGRVPSPWSVPFE